MSDFWIQTVSGGDVDLLEPSDASIRIEDIAWALSRQARYNGHTVTTSFYSVAEHSVRVADRVRELLTPSSNTLYATKLELHGLLHDAHEAYIGDVVTPFKRVLNKLAGRDIFAEAELAIRRAVNARFDLFQEEPIPVLQADAELYVTEKRDIMPNVPGERAWRRPYPPLPKEIKPWTEVGAYETFLARFERLWAQRKSLE